MYFINNEDNPEEKSEFLPNPEIVTKSVILADTEILPELKIEPRLKIALPPKLSMSNNDSTIHQSKSISTENNAVKRVYGRARANLSFSSFYIFCEDFRKQLNYLYPHKNETYYKNILSFMWKHLNIRDKHKYYETATKARTMYNLPELPYISENGQEKLKYKSTISNKSPEDINSSGSKVVGKLVKVKFSKSCIAPIITPLKLQDVVEKLEESTCGRRQDEVDGFGEGKPRQNHGEISEHQDHSAEYVPPPLCHRDGQAVAAGIDEPQGRLIVGCGVPSIVAGSASIYPAIRASLSPTTSTITTSRLLQCPQPQHPPKESTYSARPEVMLQQYQQQPDYTPYGGIGYGAQPNAGYFNYAATESSWYGSPSSGADHAQMVSDGGGPQFLDHAGLSHNACNTHIGDSTGNFLNHGYHQAASTGASTSSAESFAANNHPVSQADMDPMADFLGGHQNMTETDKIIKEESIDWLSTIINDEVDHGNNRPDVVVGDGGGGGGVGGGVAGAGGNGKLVGDLHPCKGREANGRLPNFHQAFGSTEIGRFSQHEYYEPPKDASIGECQSAGRSGSVAAQQSGASQQPDEQQPAASSFEPPRQQNRRGRAQRGGGQNRRNKQTRTALAAAAATAAAVAAQQYAGYDVTGAAVGRHQVPPYHHHHQQDPYNRNHHHHVQQQQQQRYHQEYHHQQQQPPPQTPYQNHQQEYYRPYDRMHYQQQQQQPPLPPNQYYNNSNNNNGNNSSNNNNGGAGGGSSVNNNSNREQSYNAGGYNRFHSCCSTEHIARPNHHHNYGPGQYYGDYNTYNQW